MRICSSVGRVTVAVPLLTAAISLLLLLEVFQHDIQLLEPLGPRVLVGLHPVMDGLSAWPLSRYRRCRPSSRTSTAPTSRSTRRCLDTCGWASPSRGTRSLTGRSPSCLLYTSPSPRD